MKKLPNKYKVRHETSKAISNGLIKKQTCEVCGSEKSECHHNNYYNSFDVLWLCRKHHQEWHKNHDTLKGFEEYKALFVKEATHNKVAVEAKKMRMTIDRLISDMLQIYKKHKDELNPF